MNQSMTKAWRQYEFGLEYKRRIGLFETVRRNERFYRGEQWGNEGAGLPRPVFNLIRRVTDYLVCTVASGDLSIIFSDENLPYISDPATAEAVGEAVGMLTRNAAYRWERERMDSKVYRLLTDAALSGDGVLYCWWDPDAHAGQMLSGDISTEVIDNTNLFVADVNRADIQSQEYIILSGRAGVNALRAEARRAGRDEREIAKIVPDRDRSVQSGDMAQYELEGEDGDKTTFIIKFWREDGHVVFEKSTRYAVIRRCVTPQTLYPVAYFNWLPTKNSFHGTSPVSSLIPNQKFVNRAFSMVMKHMTDTAFSKVVYDKSRIPEWSNEVGEAIAAVGGTNVADAVQVVGVGELADDYLGLIKMTVELTRDLCGATETSLGEGDATNASAILSLQEAARIPLEQVRHNYFQCIESVANIWADMMCAYYPDRRLLPYHAEGGDTASPVNFTLLRNHLPRARVEVGEISRYTAAGALSMLNRLLDAGCITPIQYIERLPAGLVSDRVRLIEQLKNTKGEDIDASK
ncbi:MAG: hypothetical protein IJY27_03830 [Clostridia bacterium]|nr:hypothetical protein [Clostridia bacterium]